MTVSTALLFVYLFDSVPFFVQRCPCHLFDLQQSIWWVAVFMSHIYALVARSKRWANCTAKVDDARSLQVLQFACQSAERLLSAINNQLPVASLARNLEPSRWSPLTGELHSPVNPQTH